MNDTPSNPEASGPGQHGRTTSKAMVPLTVWLCSDTTAPPSTSTSTSISALASRPGARTLHAQLCARHRQAVGGQLARHLITTCTGPGDVVAEAFTTSEAVLVAAAQLGRRGVACMPHFPLAQYFGARLRASLPPDRLRRVTMRACRPDQMSRGMADLAGHIGLVIAAPPPYEIGGRPANGVRGRDCPACQADLWSLTEQQLGGFLTASWRVLRPGGHLAVITTARHQDGRLVDPAPRIIRHCTGLGFRYTQHIIALRVPIEGDALVVQGRPNRPGPAPRRHHHRWCSSGGERARGRLPVHQASEVPGFGRCPMNERHGIPSVLATGQQPSRVQRKGRYTPESMRHPGKMLPAIASAVIEAYTRPDDLVVDPMCGIGTSLVEAIHLGRHAAGMEYEGDFVQLAAANLLHAQTRGASGTARLTCGDSRNIATAFTAIRGQVALVLTSPPYGSHTHGHVRSNRQTGAGGGVQKWNHRYSTDRANLAHAGMAGLLEGFGQILTGCTELLRPRGVVAVTVRPIRVKGELVDLPGLVTHTAEQAGLTLTDRLAALLCGLRDGGIVNRASFFQMLETRRARDKGIPACATAHEDLLIFVEAARPDRAAFSGTADRMEVVERPGLDLQARVERAYGGRGTPDGHHGRPGDRRRRDTTRSWDQR